MKPISGMSAPEAVGLAVVGATLGAVALGAASAGVTAHTLIGAICGATMLPAIFVVRWSRLALLPRLRKPARP